MQFCSVLFALGILDVFLELHVADNCDDGVDFSPYVDGIFGLLFGVEALPIHPEVQWIYKLAHMSLNSNNNNRLRQVGDRFLCGVLLSMDESSERPKGGVARRRRERRMRSWFRHEQQSIRMALATVLHHSYDMHTECGAPRSQNTAMRARGRREGREDEVHDQVPEDSPSPAGALPAV